MLITRAGSYFALLQTIAQEKGKLSEIVKATGLSQPVANKIPGVLGELKIIKRELPVTEEMPFIKNILSHRCHRAG